jgi:hypothetical protein
MPDDVIDLRSINWTHGMFLTPEHFLGQERYFDSMMLWLVRHCTSVHGLIGGGPRTEPSERGAARFDPIVAVDETQEELKVAVTQCRGLTRGGVFVEIDPSSAVHAVFPKKELEGVSNVGVYVVAQPHVKDQEEGLEDPVNPQIPLGRRMRYSVKLEVDAEEAEWSLLLTRLRRPEQGVRFEKVPGFIPPCAFMSSHSELIQAFSRFNERICSIADRYSLLYKAIVDFITIARSRGINLEQDQESLDFVSRMVVSLEDCAYSILDPSLPPERFFQELTKLVRSSLLYLSLSPPTKEYFRLLSEMGETEFVSILEQGEGALEMDRRWSIHDDLRTEIQSANRVLDGLDRLERALEGKYLDFRISPSLESINFFFDRADAEPVLYKSVAKPARPQAHGQELTFVFAPLRLEAREVYRLVLVGDNHATFVSGDELHIELRINKGEGYDKPEYLSAQWEIDGQRNFAADFNAPEDIITINDIRISLKSSQPIRSAILYVRARLMPGLSGPAASPRREVVQESTAKKEPAISRTPKKVKPVKRTPKPGPARPTKRRSRLS